MILQDIYPTPQCCLLKCECKPFHMWEDPRHPGKGQGHRFVDRCKLTLYTWGWCTVWLTGSQIQSIAGSVLCMWLRCDTMDPMVSSTPHSGHGIHLRSLTRYEYPNPVHFSAMASSDIPICNASVWHVILCDLETLATRSYLLKRPTRTFIACYS